MRNTALAALAAVTTALGALPAAAQQPSAEHFFRPGSIALSLYGGGAAFSTLYRTDPADPLAETAPREVAARTSSALAAEAVWWLSPSFGVRVHGSFLPSRFETRGAAATAALPRLSTGADTATWSGVNVWIADVAALIRPPFTLGRVAPYAILGGGVVTYRPRGDEALPPGIESSFERGTHTRAAAVMGLGVAVPLQRNRLLLSFALTNHLTRPVVKGNEQISTTSHVRLLAGITVPLRTGH